MKKCILFLIFTIIFSGCGVRDMEEINTSQEDTLSVVSPDGNPVTENAKEENTTQQSEQIVIDGEADSELKADDNGIIFPQSVIEKAEFQLPGYENVVVELEVFKEELLSIFNNLRQIEKEKDHAPYSELDGAELNIYCKAGGQNYKVSFATRYNGKTVTVRVASGDGSLSETAFSGGIISSELTETIHKITGWKEFDLNKLREVETMEVRVNDLAMNFSKEQTADFMDRIIASAKLENWNGCPFHVIIKMYKGNEVIYNARLSGDSCPSIGIEGQYFNVKVDRAILKEIYDAMGYDMDVGGLDN